MVKTLRLGPPLVDFFGVEALAFICLSWCALVLVLLRRLAYPRGGGAAGAAELRVAAREDSLGVVALGLELGSEGLIIVVRFRIGLAVDREVAGLAADVAGLLLLLLVPLRLLHVGDRLGQGVELRGERLDLASAMPALSLPALMAAFCSSLSWALPALTDIACA